MPFVDAVANVALRGDKAVTLGSSFVRPQRIASLHPTVSAKSFLPNIESAARGPQNEEIASWYEVYVDAHSGELLSLRDFTAEARDTLVPSQGWHTSGTTVAAGISGRNNIVAYKSWQSSSTSQSLVFDYTYSTSRVPSTTNDVNAARTDSFYPINGVHNITYRYGFTEAAFNSRTTNLERVEVGTIGR
ncbi:hypothetical protein EST38_g12791 [Candolleomyces aberdarensis]|uniref:Extracellular metalloproteinase n=1 Tax=Candolleomyces aberdarensis TaxID=2316362 RepID=A0A4Q2D1K8_9AGAR|nr:hypothetical protein EST38_g12791 [Candolleomyces aberdarensis]